MTKTAFELVVGDLNYSSWSVRPWFFLREKNVPVAIEVVHLGQADTSARLHTVSPSARVPVVHAMLDGQPYIVHDSLAIGLVLADLMPEMAVFPKSTAQRARAYAACAEMHSSFTEMRRVLTCNKRRRYAPELWRQVAGGEETIANIERDIARVTELWQTALQESGGPFLCGEFGYVDAYFAPVASRFRTYGVTLPASAEQYVRTLEATAAWRAWGEVAAQDITVAKYEYA